MDAKVRTYYGVNIHPETAPNSAGIRYWARTGRGLMLRAQTLAGMRELIRAYCPR